MFYQFVLFAVIGLYGANGHAFSTCSNETFTELLTCYSKFTYSGVIDFYMVPSTSSCGHKDEFGSLTKCIVDVYLKCYDEIFKTILPTSEMNEKAMNYFCSRKDTYDMICLASALVDVMTCILEEVEPLPLTNATFEEMKAYTCGYQKNFKNCTENTNKFSECQETKTTYLEVNRLTIREAGREEAWYLEDLGSTATPVDQSKSSATPVLVDQSKSSATPADQSKISATPIDQSKSSATPVDQSKSPATPADQSKSSATPVDQSKSPATPADQSKSSATPVDQSKSPDTPADQSKSSATPADQSKCSATPVDQSKSSASPMYQSVGLLTVVTFVKIIF